MPWVCPSIVPAPTGDTKLTRLVDMVVMINMIYLKSGETLHIIANGSKTQHSASAPL